MAQAGRVIARNRKARHLYHIEETYEAGIVLQGTEVKSIRAGKINFKDSYGVVENGEVFLYNMHISPYEHGNRYNHDVERKRKLLLNRREIKGLIGYLRNPGYTFVPLQVYFNDHNLVKIEMGLGRGKKLYDKRQDLAEKTAKRQMDRAMKDKLRG